MMNVNINELSDYWNDSDSKTIENEVDLLSSVISKCTVDEQIHSLSKENNILSNQRFIEPYSNAPFSFPMSVPNPKRSVPVNFLQIINEDYDSCQPIDHALSFNTSQTTDYTHSNPQITHEHYKFPNSSGDKSRSPIHQFTDNHLDPNHNPINLNNFEMSSSSSSSAIRKIVGTIGRPKSTPIQSSTQRFQGFYNDHDSFKDTINIEDVLNAKECTSVHYDPYKDVHNIHRANNDHSFNINDDTGRMQHHYVQQDSLSRSNSNSNISYHSTAQSHTSNENGIGHQNSSEIGNILRGSGGTVSAPPLRHYKENINMLDGANKSFHAPNNHSSSSVFTGHTTSLSSCSGDNNTGIIYVDSGSIEDTVLRNCREILFEASENSLKAVELANTLRARVGIEILAQIREKWGGLLSLLEKASNTGETQFRVDRIPKSDKVTLISSNIHSSSGSSPSLGHQEISRNYENNDLAFQTSTATRCLHVGNVPSNLSEIQLMQEFEKFGQLDGLKLVSQRNGSRRFAFVTFRTIEQAITAKHCLSKLHPWKSVISFARKEFSHQQKANHHHPPTTTQHHYDNNVINNYKQNVINKRLNHNEYYVDPVLIQNSYGFSVPIQSNFNINHPSAPYISQMMHGNQSAVYSMNNNYHASLSNVENKITSLGNNILQPICKVLQRLCDDTYVPTQPWPIDVEKDYIYCQAVIAQLQQFGGYCTISKLRGFLRNRIAAVDNIKSVPLKAMLTAYPQYFFLESNHISLANNAMYSR